MIGTMKSKPVGVTVKFADEQQDRVVLYPILEYEDPDTGFKFLDVGEDALGTLELGTCTKEQLANFFRANDIENGVEIVEAHIKMHMQNICEYEQSIKEYKNEISFYEKIFAKEDD